MKPTNEILNVLKTHKAWVRGKRSNGETFGGRIESFGLNKFIQSFGFCLTVQRCVVTNIDLDTLSLSVQRKKEGSVFDEVITVEQFLKEVEGK